MNVIKVKLSELNPDPKNTRVHDAHNIEIIKKSLKRFGQYRSFVVQKQGMIIRVGNGMFQAMKELQWEEADCEIKDITDEEATTLSILDNKSSDLSYFDDAKLFTELKGLSKTDIAMTGFVDLELNKIFSSFEGDNDLSSVKNVIEKNNDKKKAKEGQKPSVLQYQLIFADEEQFKKWIAFVDYIRVKYDMPITDCFLQFIEEHVPELGETIETEYFDDGTKE